MEENQRSSKGDHHGERTGESGGLSGTESGRELKRIMEKALSLVYYTAAFQKRKRQAMARRETGRRKKYSNMLCCSLGKKIYMSTSGMGRNRVMGSWEGENC